MEKLNKHSLRNVQVNTEALPMSPTPIEKRVGDKQQGQYSYRVTNQPLDSGATANVWAQSTEHKITRITQYWAIKED